MVFDIMVFDITVSRYDVGKCPQDAGRLRHRKRRFCGYKRRLVRSETMDVVEFFKTVNRLRKNQRCCKECPIHKNDDMGCMVRADDDSIKSIDETVSKVEQWAKDNPIKTRQSEFLKLFPDAETDESGILIFCPRKFDPENINSVHCHRHGCLECRKDYWLTEVTNND